MRGGAAGGFWGAVFGAVLGVIVGYLVGLWIAPFPSAPEPGSDLSVGGIAQLIRASRIHFNCAFAGGILGAIAFAGPGACFAARGRRLRAAAGGFLGALLGAVLVFSFVYHHMSNSGPFNPRDQGIIDTMKGLEGPGGHGPVHDLSILKTFTEGSGSVVRDDLAGVSGILAAIGGAGLGAFLATWRRRLPLAEVQT